MDLLSNKICSIFTSSSFIQNQISKIFISFFFSSQFISNLIIPDHDAHVFNPPLWSLTNQTIYDQIIHKLFSGLRRWDAIHFLHIARFGYIYENTLAFFPGYPLLFIRPLGLILTKILSSSNAYLLSGILINFIFGFFNTYVLYKLGLKYHLTPNHALWSSILYIINPATIFFLAPYSETLFLFSQLLGHYYLKSDKIFYSYLCFALGSIIRSNGIISFGFICYYYLQKIYQKKTWIIPIHYFILFFLPFFLSQYYQYKEYCFEKSIPNELQIYGINENLPMPLTNFSSPWCLKTLPLSYQYVQKTYWNVGFLNYWQLKQIPNFFLALPIFIFLIKFLRNWLNIIIKNGLWKNKFTYLFLNKSPSKINIWFIEKDIFPHIIYTIFLSLFALFFMHIQVTTRFLFSSGPFLYLIFADQIKQYNILNGNLRKIFYLFNHQTFLFYYFFLYVIIGICLFSNFLPWT